MDLLEIKSIVCEEVGISDMEFTTKSHRAEVVIAKTLFIYFAVLFSVNKRKIAKIACCEECSLRNATERYKAKYHIDRQFRNIAKEVEKKICID